MRDRTRRLRAILAAVVVLLLPACAVTGGGEKGEGAEEISPAEDLMREHGVLRRILLIYKEAERRDEAKQELPLGAIHESAQIVRNFIENYHEKLEEDYLFPRYRKAGQQAELVDILLQQHQAGRRLTSEISRLSEPATAAGDRGGRRRLVASMQEFARMYRPHAAREDTELFPALKKVVSHNEMKVLGDVFEDKEKELFGEEGFEKTVARVAAIEKGLNINDLSQFTPR